MIDSEAQLVKREALELFQRSNGHSDVYTVYAKSKLTDLCIWAVAFPKRMMTIVVEKEVFLVVGALDVFKKFVFQK